MKASGVSKMAAGNGVILGGQQLAKSESGSRRSEMAIAKEINGGMKEKQSLAKWQSKAKKRART
jgi:hypothetical protein